MFLRIFKQANSRAPLARSERVPSSTGTGDDDVLQELTVTREALRRSEIRRDEALYRYARLSDALRGVDAASGERWSVSSHRTSRTPAAAEDVRVMPVESTSSRRVSVDDHWHSVACKSSAGRCVSLIPFPHVEVSISHYSFSF